MALLIGIDLCQKPLRVGGSAMRKYFVGKGSKEANLSAGGDEPNRAGGDEPSDSDEWSEQFSQPRPFDSSPDPNQVDFSNINELFECFKDAREVCKSNFGSGEIKAAVVVVPNITGRRTVLAIESAGSSANVRIQEVINENIAIATAYAVKTKLDLQTKLCIVSTTSGIIDVSLVSVKPYSRQEYEYTLLRHDVHRGSEEGEQHEKKQHPGFPGVFGAVSSVLLSSTNCAMEATPITNLIQHTLSNFLEGLVGKSDVVKLVFVGTEAGSEKLQEAVKGRFHDAEVWKAIDEEPEELAAYGAAVLAAEQKPVNCKIEYNYSGVGAQGSGVGGGDIPPRNWNNF